MANRQLQTLVPKAVVILGQTVAETHQGPKGGAVIQESTVAAAYAVADAEQAFPVKVTAFEPGRKMVLTGGMPLGLFKSERTHTLTPGNDGQTVFHTKEIFSGLLLPVFGKNLPDLTENFEGFAAALKKQAEKSETK